MFWLGLASCEVCGGWLRVIAALEVSRVIGEILRLAAPFDPFPAGRRVHDSASGPSGLRGKTLPATGSR